MTLPVIEEIRAIIAEGEQKVRDLIEQRGPEIAHAAAAVDAVDNDGLVQAVQAAVGLTPGARAAISAFIGAIDAEFSTVAQDAAANGRAAGLNAAAAADAGGPPGAPGE